MPAKTHGHSVNHMSSPTYKKWSDMKQRCLNPLNSNFKNYGEKGIIVCERWLTFENFLSDMGESSKGLTLDRIDSNGDYSAENCRWISWIENNRNKSRVRLNSSQVSQVKLALQEFGMPREEKMYVGLLEGNLEFREKLFTELLLVDIGKMFRLQADSQPVNAGDRAGTIAASCAAVG